MLNSGIYKITNSANGKAWVGQSYNLRKRQLQHLRLFAQNKNSPHLQRAWNKYGAGNFAFQVVEYCCETSLTEREQWWMDHLKVADSRYGYNMCPAAASCKGVKHTAATKAKISAAVLNRGKKLSIEKVRIIKERLSTGEVHSEIAASFGVSDHLISCIKNEKVWNNIRPDLHCTFRKLKRTGADVLHSKLSLTDVEGIRLRLLEGHTLKSIANNYGVNAVTIYDIKHGHAWADSACNEKYVVGQLKGTSHAAAKLTEANVYEIRELIKNGSSHSEIAKIYGIGRTAVANIRSGKTWKHLL